MTYHSGNFPLEIINPPKGLHVLMEGLAREVLRHKPTDIYKFSADYFEKLVNLRDDFYRRGQSTEVQEIVKACFLKDNDYNSARAKEYLFYYKKSNEIDENVKEIAPRQIDTTISEKSRQNRDTLIHGAPTGEIVRRVSNVKPFISPVKEIRETPNNEQYESPRKQFDAQESDSINNIDGINGRDTEQMDDIVEEQSVVFIDNNEIIDSKSPDEDIVMDEEARSDDYVENSTASRIDVHKSPSTEKKLDIVDFPMEDEKLDAEESTDEELKANVLDDKNDSNENASSTKGSPIDALMQDEMINQIIEKNDIPQGDEINNQETTTEKFMIEESENGESESIIEENHIEAGNEDEKSGKTTEENQASLVFDGTTSMETVEENLVTADDLDENGEETVIGNQIAKDDNENLLLTEDKYDKSEQIITAESMKEVSDEIMIENQIVKDISDEMSARLNEDDQINRESNDERVEEYEATINEIENSEETSVPIQNTTDNDENIEEISNENRLPKEETDDNQEEILTLERGIQNNKETLTLIQGTVNDNEKSEEIANESQLSTEKRESENQNSEEALEINQATTDDCISSEEILNEKNLSAEDSEEKCKELRARENKTDFGEETMDEDQLVKDGNEIIQEVVDENQIISEDNGKNKNEAGKNIVKENQAADRLNKEIMKNIEDSQINYESKDEETLTKMQFITERMSEISEEMVTPESTENKENNQMVVDSAHETIEKLISENETSTEVKDENSDNLTNDEVLNKIEIQKEEIDDEAIIVENEDLKVEAKENSSTPAVENDVSKEQEKSGYILDANICPTDYTCIDCDKNGISNEEEITKEIIKNTRISLLGTFNQQNANFENSDINTEKNIVDSVEASIIDEDNESNIKESDISCAKSIESKEKIDLSTKEVNCGSENVIECDKANHNVIEINNPIGDSNTDKMELVDDVEVKAEENNHNLNETSEEVALNVDDKDLVDEIVGEYRQMINEDSTVDENIAANCLISPNTDEINAFSNIETSQSDETSFDTENSQETNDDKGNSYMAQSNDITESGSPVPDNSNTIEDIKDDVVKLAESQGNQNQETATINDENVTESPNRNHGVLTESNHEDHNEINLSEKSTQKDISTDEEKFEGFADKVSSEDIKKVLKSQSSKDQAVGETIVLNNDDDTDTSYNKISEETVTALENVDNCAMSNHNADTETIKDDRTEEAVTTLENVNNCATNKENAGIKTANENHTAETVSILENIDSHAMGSEINDPSFVSEESLMVPVNESIIVPTVIQKLYISSRDDSNINDESSNSNIDSKSAEKTQNTATDLAIDYYNEMSKEDALLTSSDETIKDDKSINSDSSIPHDMGLSNIEQIVEEFIALEKFHTEIVNNVNSSRSAIENKATNAKDDEAIAINEISEISAENSQNEQMESFNIDKDSIIIQDIVSLNNFANNKVILILHAEINDNLKNNKRPKRSMSLQNQEHTENIPFSGASVDDLILNKLTSEYNKYQDSVATNNNEILSDDSSKTTQSKNYETESESSDANVAAIFDNRLNETIEEEYMTDFEEHVIVESDSEKSDLDKNVSSSDADKNIFEKASVIIQKVFRGFRVRKSMKTESGQNRSDSVEDAIFEKIEEPISKVNKSDAELIDTDLKRRLNILLRSTSYHSPIDSKLYTVSEEKNLSSTDDDSSTFSSAATKIQAGVRGFLTRKYFQRNRTGNSSDTTAPSIGEDSRSVEEYGTGDMKNSTDESLSKIVVATSNILMEQLEHFDKMDSTSTRSIPDINLTEVNKEFEDAIHRVTQNRKKLRREDAIQLHSPFSSGETPTNRQPSKVSEEEEQIGELAQSIICEIETDSYVPKVHIKQNDASPVKEDDTKIISLDDEGEKFSDKGDTVTQVDEFKEKKFIDNQNSSDNDSLVHENIFPKIPSDIDDSSNSDSNELDTTKVHYEKRIPKKLPRYVSADIETLVSKQKVDDIDESVAELDEKYELEEINKANSGVDETSEACDENVAVEKSEDDQKITMDRIIHSSEFHDSLVLPTKIIRKDDVQKGE